VIGTSIGAINASLIDGNKPGRRLAKLRAFWKRIEQDPALEAIGRMPFFGTSLMNWVTLTSGVANFFRPNPLAFWGQNVPLAANSAGFYSTEPLEATLNELVDFSLVANGAFRLTVGAANVRTAELTARLPKEERDSEPVREMAGYGCLTRMHVVRLLAPRLEGEDHTKDIDFSHRHLRALEGRLFRYAAGPRRGALARRVQPTRRVLSA
jgi:Patatin phospholipase